jgi:hypothetical protein
VAVVSDAFAAPGLRLLSGSLEIETSADEAFALLCAVEKWPVWLSFIRSARVADRSERFGLGSEVVVRSVIPSDEEHVYEIDHFIANHHLSLVGAFSVRRRIDFRIEGRTDGSKIHAHVSYPAYHGRLGAFVDRLTRGRKLALALDHSLIHFKGLVEYRREPDNVLADL